jgi:trk system potassium uptake protein TrkH
MVIGASPGSTGGGIKTTTAGLLFYSSLSEIRGKSMAIGNRKISDGNVIRTQRSAEGRILFTCWDPNNPQR